MPKLYPLHLLNYLAINIVVYDYKIGSHTNI